MTDFSYQLYSSRNFPPLGDTLNMLAQTGYSQVEGYGALFSDDTDLGALRAALDASGLSMPTAHIGVDLMKSTPLRVMEIARALDIKMVVGPYLAEPDRPMTVEGWTAFGKMLGEAAKPLQDAGLDVAWHNHDFEFSKVDGQFPMDLILESAPEVLAEFDIAWCVRGGQDPVAWIEVNAARLAAVHIKDIAPAGEAVDEDGWADVGLGTIDWAPIVAALRNTPCRYFVAEHDNPNDHQRFATRSLAAMRSF